MPRRSAPRARAAAGAALPLLTRFPALASIPRVPLGHFPSPVEQLAGFGLWIKRDDLCADPLGGNKTRALEFLLGALPPAAHVVTVGSAGSTHALAVATHAQRAGATVAVGRWQQELNATAAGVAEQVGRLAERAPVFRSVIGAYAWAIRERLRGASWIAAGGSTALGILGHVNAGLELVAQIDAGELPMPERVVVPLGTGGTAAGLALGFAIAERPITVVAARVVPRVVARRGRVLGLAAQTRQLIARTTGDGAIPRVDPARLIVAHEQYGGAYGRESADGQRLARQLLEQTGIRLDGTYSAKAFAIAASLADRGPTVFWLTFDSRTLSRP